MDDSEKHTGSDQSAPTLPPGPSKREPESIVLLDDLGRGNILQETVIEGGHVPAGPPDFIAKSREKTRGELVTKLVWLLGLLLVVHYVSVSIAVLTGKAEFKLLETAFNASLPALAGLLGSAVAFYFKDR